MKKKALILLSISTIALSGLWLRSPISSPSEHAVIAEPIPLPTIQNTPSREAFLSSFHKEKVSLNTVSKKDRDNDKNAEHSEKINTRKTSPEEDRDADLEYNADKVQSLPQLSSTQKTGSVGNQKPKVDNDIQQQLQTMMYAWNLTQSTPVNYSFNINGLFYDEEHDFITTRVRFSYPGLSLINRGELTLVGSPIESDKPTQFIISAKDDYHGNKESAWTHVSFDLPSTEESNSSVEHPLIGHTLYRLETTNHFAGHSYEYEVVYCEAFKFINNLAYYAASTNKRTCPTEESLSEVGTYAIDDKHLIVTSSYSAFDAEQRWKILHSYESSFNKGESLLTTIHNGKEFETYTILKNKRAMESRLNVVTGQTPYQMEKFEYFFPTDKQGNYIKGTAGMYMMDSRLVNPNWFELDSDLNIHSDTHNMTCDFVVAFYQSSTMGGQGASGISITSSSIAPNYIDPLECEERINSDNGKRYAYLDLDYSPYDEFVDGGIYSYILKPKPEYAHLVEEFKVNLIYHAPNLS
ncbi:hypothetical protein [Aliivibrio fischeri]|uniref:hypothetical protein n=1 Tax=Aliivibrio fischeri TaxID=668 RepID=UPI000908143A|nr:hypothetical protein [Aliivibrio fischeri]